MCVPPGLHYRLIFSGLWDRIRKNFIRIVDVSPGALPNAFFVGRTNYRLEV
jgi:hypothetical protein